MTEPEFRGYAWNVAHIAVGLIVVTIMMNVSVWYTAAYVAWCTMVAR